MKDNLVKIYFAILISAFSIQDLTCAITSFENNSNEKFEHSSNFTIEQGNHYTFIKISQSPPDQENNPKKYSFDLMKKHLDKNKRKIAVIWQKDEHHYGRNFSIAGVYIKDYLNNKINEQKIYDYIIETEILPSPISRNNIKKNSLITIEKKYILKASNLRKKANIYRVNKQYDSALRIYKQAININPNDIISYYWVAEIYKTTDKLKLAEDYYIKALKISPSFNAADNALFELRKSKEIENEQ